MQLPKLRKEITFAFSDYDVSGKPQWTMHDPGRNKFFIIGWVEYQILMHWNLGDPDAIVSAINEETTLQIEARDVENILQFLKQNYLIDQSGYQIHQLGKEQKLFKSDSWIHSLIMYYLFFRIPLVHPDAFLKRTQHIALLVFHRYVGYVMAVLGIIAVYQVSDQWTLFVHTFPAIFTWQGLFFSLIAFLLCKLCHELGHAYMCTKYGIYVPSLGVAFLVFWPVLYTDTTLSWSLNSKQRLQIALAGIWVESYIVIIAALIWANTHNLTLQSICYVTITVNWIGSLLINASPFMRFDGYYILADFLKMPNLQPRAFALTRWQIRRWLFDWPDPPPEQYSKNMHNLLVAYSLFTWAYRLILYFGIALLVYHFFIKIVGIILFAIEMFYFILGPIVTEVKNWVTYKDRFVLNVNTTVTSIGAGILIFLFFLPIQDTIKMPATLSYDHEFLIAPEEGVLETMPALHAQVKAGQIVVTLYSAELEYALKRVQLEYNKKLSELRNAKINVKNPEEISVLLSDINKARSEYKKFYSLRERLLLKALQDGVVTEIAPDLRPGMYVAKGEWIADVTYSTIGQVEAYVPQTDLDYVKIGLSGYFYPHSLSDSRIPIKVTEIDPINTTQLNCQYSSEIKEDKNQNNVADTPCYHANELGGAIATYDDSSGNYTPVDSIYRVLLTSDKSVNINHIERGTVVLYTASRSYASRFFYMIRKIWVRERNLS